MRLYISVNINYREKSYLFATHSKRQFLEIIMDNSLNEKTLQRIQEEIRTRVFEIYAEKQGIKTQLSEIEATIEALSEVTNLSIDEIRQVAEQVTNRVLAERSTQISEITPPSPDQFSLAPRRFIGKIEHKLLRRKRKFYTHLVVYSVTNLLLFFINAIDGGDPWFFFPLIGWAAGLIPHYLWSVHYFKRDILHMKRILSEETHHILQDNIPYYLHNQEYIYNGVLRLVYSNSTGLQLQEFLRNASPESSLEDIDRAIVQLIQFRENVLEDYAPKFKLKK